MTEDELNHFVNHFWYTRMSVLGHNTVWHTSESLCIGLLHHLVKDLTAICGGEPDWEKLDGYDGLAALFGCIASDCWGLDALLSLAIFCLDRGMHNCQMEFANMVYKDHGAEYLLQSVHAAMVIIS